MKTLNMLENWTLSSVLQDHVYQPFADVLPYPEFSITLGVKDIPNLLDILEAVPVEDIEQYRIKMWVRWIAYD